MKLPNYTVAAFTGQGLAGNPAAVCPLDAWLPAPVMQAIAHHNALPETAFFVESDGIFTIRWFTPTHEANMCGHATLASTWALRHLLGRTDEQFEFRSAFGYEMTAVVGDEFITLDFPAGQLAPSKSEAPARALGVSVEETLLGQSWVCRLSNEATVRSYEPDIEAIGTLAEDGIIITAKGENCDFVSRYFTPQSGIPEDPVTGYAHTLLVPYWAKKLNRKKLHALQVSRRGGELFCELRGERVLMQGRASLESEGALIIDAESGTIEPL